MADIPPNHSVYIRNLNEKVQKEELKRSLYALMSQHGQVLDIVALKTTKMRGQAFVAFKEIPSATQAIRSLQGFYFYDKPMKLAFARSDTKMIARMKGSYVAPKGKADGKKKASEVSRKKRITESANVASNEVNRVLFCTQLPEETTRDMLHSLFSQFPGFSEVRMVGTRTDIAFIEFEGEAQSTIAKDSLNGFKMTPSHAMQISFAKK